jgi:prevent-host-death family protein
MLDITKDTQSITTFRRRSGEFMKQIEKTKRPVVVTVKGKAQVVIQDVEGYQRLLDIAAAGDAREGIRQGLEHAQQGLMRDAKEFFAEFRAKQGTPRKNRARTASPRTSKSV